MTARIIVFGRQPVPGRVKTRLAETVGATSAARVYELLLAHTLAEAATTGVAVRLALAAPPTPGWQPPNPVDVTVQSEGDLGERMAGAFAAEFASGARRVILIGSDAPAVGAAVLSEALAELAAWPVVLGPAADGGYWLVGQRAPGAALFSGVPWSTSGTLAATRHRLAALGLRHAEVAVLRDLDTEADLIAAMDDPAVDPVLRTRLRAAVDLNGGK